MIVLNGDGFRADFEGKMFKDEARHFPHPNKIELVTNETIYKHNINHGNVIT